MLSLIDYLFGVQPTRPANVRVPEPLPVETGPTVEDEPFRPSPADLAYDLAYAAALAGEPARSPWPATPFVLEAHRRGTMDGTEQFVLDLESWADRVGHDRFDAAGPITDRDMYRLGSVS